MDLVDRPGVGVVVLVGEEGLDQRGADLRRDVVGRLVGEARPGLDDLALAELEVGLTLATAGVEVDVYVTGRKAEAYLRFRQRPIVQAWTGFSSPSTTSSGSSRTAVGSCRSIERNRV